MRIKLSFTPNSDSLVLPVHYNYLLQSMIYRNLERSLADWLHEEGFRYYKRKFKLFTFSRLFGKFRREGDNLVYTGQVWFKIGSPYTKLLESLATHLVKAHEIIINRQKCVLDAIEVEMKKEFKGPQLIKMLSPMTIYSTLKDAEGKKKTYYYAPWEKEFEKLILENLRKKVLVFNGNEDIPSLENAWIKPVKVNKKNLHVIKFKNTVIKAWSGIYELHLPEPYMSMAYYGGLGSKNSQGFGMWEVVDGGNDNLQECSKNERWEEIG